MSTSFRLTSRSLVRLSPMATEGEEAEDVAEFLQGLVTQDVHAPSPSYGALLTSQGKCMFDFLIWTQGHGAILLDCESNIADDLVKRLSLYRLRRKIAIEVDRTLAVYWSVDAPANSDSYSDPRLPELGSRWLAAPNSDTPEGDSEWLAHRLSLGIPEGQAELGDVLWLETNAIELNGVSFDKGCYVGQENTARMNWRNKVNRRLIVVPISQSDEKRNKARYPELDLAVDHLRVSDIQASSAPSWLASALEETG